VEGAEKSMKTKITGLALGALLLALTVLAEGAAVRKNSKDRLPK
jgi:hypothetical protein